MTLQETISLLYLAKNLYPRDKSLDKPEAAMMDMAKAWAEMLRDIPFELGKAAVAAHAAASAFAPAISEIRFYVRRMTEPEPLSADEAWELARRAIARFGSGSNKVYPSGKYPRELARDSLPPAVWRIMEMLGYTYMCRSEKPEVIHAQFIAAWERQQKRREEEANLLPFLPPALREKMLAIGEGQNDGADGRDASST